MTSPGNSDRQNGQQPGQQNGENGALNNQPPNPAGQNGQNPADPLGLQQAANDPAIVYLPARDLRRSSTVSRKNTLEDRKMEITYHASRDELIPCLSEEHTLVSNLRSTFETLVAEFGANTQLVQSSLAGIGDVTVGDALHSLYDSQPSLEGFLTVLEDASDMHFPSTLTNFPSVFRRITGIIRMICTIKAEESVQQEWNNLQAEIDKLTDLNTEIAESIPEVRVGNSCSSTLDHPLRPSQFQSSASQPVTQPAAKMQPNKPENSERKRGASANDSSLVKHPRTDSFEDDVPSYPPFWNETSTAVTMDRGISWYMKNNELMKFSGKLGSLPWPTFWLRFCRKFHRIRSADLSDSDKLEALGYYTTGEANQLVSSFLTSDDPESYSRAIITLQSTYGAEGRSYTTVQNEMRALTPLSHTCSQYLAYLSKLNSLISEMRALGVDSKFCYCSAIEQILEKFDSNLVQQYRTARHYEGQEAWNFYRSDPEKHYWLFTNWIRSNMSLHLKRPAQQIEILEDSSIMQTRTEEVKTPKTPQTPKKEPQAEKAKPVENSPARTWSRKSCTLCDTNDHKWTECPLSLEEKRSIIRERKLCYNCLGPKHNSSNCRSTRNCFNCNGRHHTTLCTEPRKNKPNSQPTTPNKPVSAAEAAPSVNISFLEDFNSWLGSKVTAKEEKSDSTSTVKTEASTSKTD